MTPIKVVVEMESQQESIKMDLKFTLNLQITLPQLIVIHTLLII